MWNIKYMNNTILIFWEAAFGLGTMCLNVHVYVCIYVDIRCVSKSEGSTIVSRKNVVKQIFIRFCSRIIVLQIMIVMICFNSENRKWCSSLIQVECINLNITYVFRMNLLQSWIQNVYILLASAETRRNGRR